MSTLKRVIALSTLVILMVTSNLPSIAASSTSKTVSIKKFTETLLETLEIPYTDPIKEAINQKWVSSEHKLIKVPESAITKEQSAQFLYSVLRQRENIKPDIHFERLLSCYIEDNKNIDPSYKRAVYSTIMSGFYEPKVVNKTAKYFYPKNRITESEMSLMMVRLLDETKRNFPYHSDGLFRLNDRNKSWGISPGLEAIPLKVTLSAVIPKLSNIKKEMEFQNNYPVQDKNIILKELDEDEYDPYSPQFNIYYKYTEYVKLIPPIWQDVYYPDEVEKLNKEEVAKWTTSGSNFIKAYFNINYKNLPNGEKNIKKNISSYYDIYQKIEQRKSLISKNKIIIESYYVTDPTTFYYSYHTYSRGRLYFKMTSINKTVPFEIETYSFENPIVKLKTNTWYYTDLDVDVGFYCGRDDQPWSWKGNDDVGWFYQVSDIYEIVEKK